MGLTKPPGLEQRCRPVLGLSVVALLAGLTGALVLLGLPMPAGALPLAATHGVLMTLGSLGTLIALERAPAPGDRDPSHRPRLDREDERGDRPQVRR